MDEQEKKKGKRKIEKRMGMKKKGATNTRGWCSRKATVETHIKEWSSVTNVS